MKTLVRAKFKRPRFSEPFNDGVLPLQRVEAPVEKDGRVFIISTYVEAKQPEEVPYEAFTAARVYELGEVQPIQLFNNMTSVDKFEYIQTMDGRIDNAMNEVAKSKKSE